MLIKLSEPNLFFDLQIQGAAEATGCYGRIRWAKPCEVRFVLVARPLSNTPATCEQHEQVIRSLLQLDPKAKIRTAKAFYDGLADYEKDGRCAPAV